MMKASRSPSPTTQLPLSTPPVEDQSFRADDWGPPQRTASPEELVSPLSPSRWKGKEKEIDTSTNLASEVELGGPRPTSADPLHTSFDTARADSYPPATDETLEERKVSENLKRWELMEKQRRKKARDSRTSTSQDSTSSTARVGDITRRGSIFWSGGPSRKPAPGSHPLPTDREASPRSSLDTETGDIERTRTTRINEARHTTSGSLDSHVSDSTVSTITPNSRPADASQNPFADPPTSRDLHSENPFESARDAELAKPGGRPLRYPTPKPLGLPLTAYPTGSPPSSVTEMSIEGGRGRSTSENETGSKDRWWTDWLCGCREGPDRGGDNQAGRTNPFE